MILHKYTKANNKGGIDVEETKSHVRPLYLKAAQQEIQKSISIEEIIASIHGQLLILPGLRDLQTLKEIKEYNQAASYYRISAAGCLQRMASGDWHETLLSLLVTSLYQARNQDHPRWRTTQHICQEVPKGLRSCIDNFLRWLTLAEEHLKQTMILSQQLIGNKSWLQFIPSSSTSSVEQFS